MSPEWLAMSPAERAAYLDAQDAACAEETRLHRIDETVADALRLGGGDVGEARRFLRDALAELALRDGGDT